ncbi:MAG: hypothetical protein ABH873_03935 [Candidatus Firestonebacteria bacterium]
MRKMISILLIVGLMVGGLVVKASVADNDAFTITVTVDSTLTILCKQLDGTTAYGTWAIGAKALNTATTMTSVQGVMIKNTSTVKIDLKGGASGATVWTAGAATAQDVYTLRLKGFTVAGNPGDLSAETAVTSATPFYNEGGAGIPNATDRYVYAELKTPTISTTGLVQSITATITASIH